MFPNLSDGKFLTTFRNNKHSTCVFESKILHLIQINRIVFIYFIIQQNSIFVRDFIFYCFSCSNIYLVAGLCVVFFFFIYVYQIQIANVVVVYCVKFHKLFVFSVEKQTELSIE